MARWRITYYEDPHNGFRNYLSFYRHNGKGQSSGLRREEFQHSQEITFLNAHATTTHAFACNYLSKPTFCNAAPDSCFGCGGFGNIFGADDFRI